MADAASRARRKRKKGNAPKQIEEAAPARAAILIDNPESEDLSYGVAASDDPNAYCLPSEGGRKRKAKEEPAPQKRLSVGRRACALTPLPTDYWWLSVHRRSK